MTGDVRLALLVALLALLAPVAAADVAVRKDGRVIRHEEMKVDGKLLRWGKKLKYKESLRAYLLVEKEDGTHVWSTGFRTRLAGYHAAARDELRTRLGFLAKDAVKAKDVTVARRLYDRAQALGLDNKTMKYVQGKLVSLSKRPQKPKADKTAAILAKESALEGLPAQLLAARAAKALDAGKTDEGLYVLREALRLDEHCKPALDRLKKLAPEFPLGGARAWLDWYLEIERHGFKPATGKELELKRARHHWRPDLYGIGSGEIFLITAVKDFALVGRCLRHGELVCRSLRETFRTDKPMARERGPLTLFLYMDKKAYKDNAGDYRNIDDPSFLDWWTGEWSERDDISRFYWPTDEDDERRFLFVFRRTIVQHWMHARNPNYSVSQASKAYKNPAYWLDIGFRNMVAQGRFDVERNTWDFWNPRCRYTDSLQALARRQAGKLHAWKAVYMMTLMDANKLGDKKNIEMVRNWSLLRWLVSSYHVWKDQAIGSFNYLWHADGGKHRPKLVQAIIDHHHNNSANLPPKAICGLTSDELGKKAIEFAKRVAEGWTPGDKR